MKKTILIVFSILAALGGGGQVIAQTNLISWWQGEGNFLDTLGNNNARLDDKFGYVPGVSGQAFRFSGGCVSVPDDPSLQPSTVTVQVWAKSQSPGGYTYLVDKAKANGSGVFGGHSFALYTGGTPAAYFFCQDSANNTTAFSQSCASATNVWDGNWHQITGVFDGQNAKVYIDGVLQTNGSPTVAPPGTTLDYTGAAPLVLGDFTTNSGGLPFNGDLDDIRIFDHALSSSDIMDTFTNGTSQALTNGLISWYKADGTTADSFGHNNGLPTRTNSAPFTFGPGKNGQGFVALGGHALVDDSPTMKPTNLTVQAWVQSIAPDLYRYVLSRYPAYCLYTGPDGGLIFFSNGGGNNTPSAGAGAVWDGAWHQVTGVFDGSSNYLYLDGHEIGQTAATYKTPADGTPFVFGVATPTDSTIYQGSLDEVRLYGTNLTAAQVLNSYLTDLGGTLVGWWRAESNAVDTVASNNGTINGSVSYVAGKFTGSAFNTQGGVVDVPNAASLQPANITVEALLKASAPGANKYVVSKSYTSGSASYALLTGPTGDLVFSVNTSAGTFTSPPVSAASVWDGKFHGVAGSYDGSMVKIYLDGQLVGSGTAANGQIQYGTAFNAGDLLFGDFASTASGANFAGAIDEIRIYNSARSQKDIRADVPTGMAILIPPQSQIVQLGSNATLSVSARGPAGTAGLYYQWAMNGTNLPNATNSVLTISNIQSSQLGSYNVLVSAPGVRFASDVAPNLNGKAFQFAGGMMEIPENGSLDLQNFTYQFWARNQGSPGTYLYVVSKSRSATGGDSVALYTGGSGGLEGYLTIVRTNSGGTTVISQPHTPVIDPTNIWDGNWHQVTITWDGEFFSLYLDGQFQGANDQLFSDWSMQYDDGTHWQNDELVIAALSATSTSSLHYTGDMDEIKIFNRVLSASDVADTYANPYTSSAATTGLVSYWSADNQTPADSVGSNSGTFHPTAVSEWTSPALLSVTGTPAVLEGITISGGILHVNVTGTPGQTNVIQRSGSLNAPSWSPIVTNTVPFSFTDPIAPGASFYRAVSP